MHLKALDCTQNNCNKNYPQALMVEGAHTYTRCSQRSEGHGHIQPAGP